MPLPYLTPEIQCTAKSKRSGVRCLRPRSLNWVGCAVCKMHGAGRNPANFSQQGRESRSARAAECIAGRPVFYSIGNFLGIGGLSTQGLAGLAAVAQMAFDANKKLLASRLVPIRFDSNKFPQVDPTGQAIALVWHLNVLAKQKLKDFVPAQPAWAALSETNY